MDKIKRQACIAYMEGMAEEIRNFDASSSDSVEFIGHIKEMVNIVFEQTAGDHLYDNPEELAEGDITNDGALQLLETTHDKLREAGWTAFLFAAKTEEQEGLFVPIPKCSVCSMEEEPMCQAEVTSMMTMAALDNPALKKFIQTLCSTSRKTKSFISRKKR